MEGNIRIGPRRVFLSYEIKSFMLFTTSEIYDKSNKVLLDTDLQGQELLAK